MGSKLSAFVVALIQKPQVRGAYLADPTEAMNAAGLDVEGQALLNADRLRVILEFLDEGGPRPVPPNQQPTGGGSG